MANKKITDLIDSGQPIDDNTLFETAEQTAPSTFLSFKASFVKLKIAFKNYFDTIYAPIGGGGGSTNLGYIASPTDGIVTSDTGTDATLTLVDGTNAGLASPSMKSTWDGKQSALGYTPVTDARTLTINGTTLDLTADRSWTVGDELISNKSDSYTVSSSTTYTSTKALVDGLATKATSATTLSGYGITDGWRLGGNTLTAETIIGGTSGAFGLDIQTNGLTAFKVLSSPTSAVNYLTVVSSITYSSPTIAAAGTDTNININIKPKGTLGVVNISKVGETGLNLTNQTTGGVWYMAIGGGGIFSNNLLGFAYNGVSKAYLTAAGTFTALGGIATKNDISCIDGHTVGLSLNIATASSGFINGTSGTSYGIRIWNEVNNTFSPSSGTASLRLIDLSAFTINQTGTASGDISMINVNPTFTSNTGVFAILRSNIASGTNRFGLYINNLANYLGGNTSIGTTTNTASLTIGASTTAKASLRILAGSLPTTSAILDGNIDYNGTDLYLTKGTTSQYVLVKSLSGSATLDFPSTNAGAYSELTITITGASVGDKVFLGTPASSLPAGNCHFFSYVSTTDTVTVRFVNSEIVTALDPSSGTFNITVQKH